MLRENTRQPCADHPCAQAALKEDMYD